MTIQEIADTAIVPGTIVYKVTRQTLEVFRTLGWHPFNRKVYLMFCAVNSSNIHSFSVDLSSTHFYLDVDIAHAVHKRLNKEYYESL